MALVNTSYMNDISTKLIWHKKSVLSRWQSRHVSQYYRMTRKKCMNQNQEYEIKIPSHQPHETCMWRLQGQSQSVRAELPYTVGGGGASHTGR